MSKISRIDWVVLIATLVFCSVVIALCVTAPAQTITAVQR